MSETFHLVCHKTRKELTIGQGGFKGGMCRLWSGEPETMRLLKQFLNEHRGMPIEFMAFEEFCEAGYEEYEGQKIEKPTLDAEKEPPTEAQLQARAARKACLLSESGLFGSGEEVTR